MACPLNSIHVNSTHCACGVGQLFNRSTGSCEIFRWPSRIYTDDGIKYPEISLPRAIFSINSILEFPQSLFVFLAATLAMLLFWLLFCFLLRFAKLRDGRNVWFKLRWWISQLDVCFTTRHMLDDQQVVRKQKTELGGTFSVATWIVFVGFSAALLYEIITSRSIEVHNVRPTTSLDLVSFHNDLEFNITTISGMSCLNLRGIENVVTGNPGFTSFKSTSLSGIGNYSCKNTIFGPKLNFKCTKCPLKSDYMYISWHFVDLPGSPAAAVGFDFNFSSKNEANKKHLSFVSGTMKHGSIFEDKPLTFRGTEQNIFKFNLFPRIYHNLDHLKLMQPLFHEFIPGSYYRDNAQLQTSFERSRDGVINTTLFINYLSAYVAEIKTENRLDPVSFLADLGGLYCISIIIFFFLPIQFLYRIKKLKSEDTILKTIRNRRKAQEKWNKVRRYVAYTWDCSILDNDVDRAESGSSRSCLSRRSSTTQGMLNSARRSSRKLGQRSSTKLSLRVDKNVETTKPRSLTKKSVQINDVPNDANTCHLHGFKEDGSVWEADVTNIKKKFQILYEDNILLWEKMMDTESLLHDIAP